MLADEMPGARLIEADSLVELRMRPERLTGEIADFLDDVWKRSGRKRAAGGGRRSSSSSSKGAGRQAAGARPSSSSSKGAGRQAAGARSAKRRGA